MLALEASAAPAQKVNKRKAKTDLNVSDPDLKRSFRCEKDLSAETARSSYFTENSIKSRLGDDFFHQPCITLAKALLGKVREEVRDFRADVGNVQLNPLTSHFFFHEKNK